MKIFRLWFLVALMGVSTVVFSQDCMDPNDDPDCPGGGLDLEETPIDGGAIALLVGGAALGYKALKKKKEESGD